MINENPIGVLDSGVGGLTVVKEIIRQLPQEKIIYVGDNARCPYGPRSKEEVKKFTLELIDFLLKKNVKMIVIACNTATAALINEVVKFSVPIIGVILPGARSAIKNTKKLSIGVIGTTGTISSGAYESALKAINPRVKVISVACPKFVPVVESGELQGEDTLQIVQNSLVPFKNSGIDTLVLGCTHYPLLEDFISTELGTGIKVISSSDETAREVSTILSYQSLMSHRNWSPEHAFYTSGSRDLFKQIAFNWLGNEFTIDKLSLD